jgi:SAM-dependent methyltransferase
MDVDPRWYDSFFRSAEWLAIAQTADDEERTRTQVDFVVEWLGLGPDARVLDLACGHGRHAVELARRGLRVTGLDISEPSLAIARERAAAQSVELELVAGDMRELPWRDEFDAVLNMWTAFGYFADEADDARVLAAVRRALRPGGSLLLDTLNVFWLARGWQAHGWQELDDGRLMIEDRAYDHLAGRSTAAWTVVASDGSRTEHRHSLRAYTLPELRVLLEAAGLHVVDTWGGWDGQPFGWEAQRLIVHARVKA